MGVFCLVGWSSAVDKDQPPAKGLTGTCGDMAARSELKIIALKNRAHRSHASSPSF